MSFEITTAFVEGFRNNIYMLAQQKNARLWGKSRNESQNSEVENFERIGETEAEDIVDRHGDTPFMNSQHSRRQVTLQDADWGDLIDKLDRVKMLINPNDAYVKTGRGSGYVRWEHEANRGFLRSVAGLGRVAASIGEDDEAQRCELFCRQLDPAWPPSDAV